MGMRYYILEGHEPKLCTGGIAEWSRQFTELMRRVARDTLEGGVDVSTVFLGLDHRHGDGPPVLFETMVFEGPLDQECVQYCTWDEAEAGHRAMVAKAKEAQAKL